MSENNKFSRKIFYIFTSIESTFAFLYLVQIPTDPKNILVWGLSLNRLILLGVMAIIFVFSVFQLISKRISTIENQIIYKSKLYFSQRPALYYLMLFLSWVVIIFPAYRFGKYEVIYTRLQPLVVLFAGIIFTFLILIKLEIKKSKLFFSTFFHKKTFLFFLNFCGIIWLFLIFTRIGLDIDHDFWGGAATPILTLPMLTTLLIPLLIYTRPRDNEQWKKKFSIFLKLIPILLFLFAIIIWNLEPFTPHFFAPKVRPPNYEYYPYSDAQVYDITAQTLLNGEGYLNRGYVQRPLYGFMLFIFHKLVGQDYLDVVFLQTILYALFPVLMFYLGKRLFSPFVGISLGVMAILRELTALQVSPWMEIVHSKLYMTDNWAGFFALFITVLIIYWYLEDRENHLLLALVGVVLGIGLLIRINLLLLFIPIFIFVFFKNQLSIKNRFQRIVILGLSSFLILMPWMLRNYYQIGEFGIEPQKFRMVIETRFNVENENSSEELKSPKPSQMIVPNEVRKYDSLKNDLKNYFDILKFTTAHFLHNEIHSILIFPNSFLAESARGVIEKNDYIQETWTGEINARQLITIIINLLIIGTGISISFNKYKWFGLFPLSIHLFYNLSNGLARVSGWRYVIVTDWVVILYYMVGIIFFLNVILQKIGLIDISLKKLFNTDVDSIDAPKTEKNKKILTILSIIIVIFIAIGMVLPEVLVEKKYSGEITREEFLSIISKGGPDFEMEEINTFLQDPNSVIIHTKAFYPRYYEPGEGEPAGNVEWLLPMDNGNLGFMIMNPFVTGVSLELDQSPDHFQHNEEVYIIGKWVESIYMQYLKADAVLTSKNYMIISNYFSE